MTADVNTATVAELRDTVFQAVELLLAKGEEDARTIATLRNDLAAAQRMVTDLKADIDDMEATPPLVLQAQEERRLRDKAAQLERLSHAACLERDEAVRELGNERRQCDKRLADAAKQWQQVIKLLGLSNNATMADIVSQVANIVGSNGALVTELERIKAFNEAHYNTAVAKGMELNSLTTRVRLLAAQAHDDWQAHVLELNSEVKEVHLKYRTALYGLMENARDET